MFNSIKKIYKIILSVYDASKIYSTHKNTKKEIENEESFEQCETYEDKKRLFYDKCKELREQMLFEKTISKSKLCILLKFCIFSPLILPLILFLMIFFGTVRQILNLIKFCINESAKAIMIPLVVLIMFLMVFILNFKSNTNK